MPGKFGTSDDEDGAFSSTKSHEHVGVFGSNESINKPSAGGARGAGVFGLTTSPGAAGVFGANTSQFHRHAPPPAGVGVQGNGPDAGVSGFSENGAGVRAHSTHANAVEGFAHDANGCGVLAMNDAKDQSTATDGSPHGCGVLGVTTVLEAAGVYGANNATKGVGVFGIGPEAGISGSNNGTTGVGVKGTGPEAGISGTSESGAGVRGHSGSRNAVEGFAHHPDGHGVLAINDAKDQSTATDGHPHGCGVLGVTTVPEAAGVYGANNATKGVGVFGIGPEAGISGSSDQGPGVQAHSDTGPGVQAHSIHANGIEGFAHKVDQSGIFGMNDSFGAVSEGMNRPGGSGVWGHTKVVKGSGVVGSVEPGALGAAGITGIGPIAGRFHGDVEVTGDVRLVGGDCAENFDVETPEAEPGTVMVIGQHGVLRRCTEPYDKKVTGVVSGAGSYRPGIILDSQPSPAPRQSIALFGKVFCKVDADFSSIEAGDLLTTSTKAGHAMKATDPVRSFGAVIGKALKPLAEGQGLIPILIALQ